MIRRYGGPAGKARLSNVELYRMGQSRNDAEMFSGLGRYPFHWHMNLNGGAGQYVRDSSIHHNYNRGVTVHGTEDARVERNVVYDTLGHTLFLEDGSETGNEINDNLVVSTNLPDPSHAVTPSDVEGESFQNRSPACFWITNPDNRFTGNLATGTVGTGYWFAFPTSPIGESATEPYFTAKALVPNETNLLDFAGNVCHGARSGFDVNDAVASDHSIIENVGWKPGGWTALDDFTVYACETALYAGVGFADIAFDNAILADNQRGITFAAYHWVENSIIVADTQNDLIEPFFQGSIPGVSAYSLYDGAGRLRDCHIVGYDLPGTSLLHNIGGATKHVNHLFTDLTFEPPDVASQVMHLPDFAAASLACGSTAHNDYDPRQWMVAIRDEDGIFDLGGVSEDPPVTIIGNHPMMNRTFDTGALDVGLGPGLVEEDEQWPGSDVWISPYRFGHLRIRHENAQGHPMPAASDIRFTRRAHPNWEEEDFLNCSTVDQHKQCAVVLNEGYEYEAAWEYGAFPPTAAKEVLATLDDLSDGDDLVVQLVWSGDKAGVTFEARSELGPVTLEDYDDFGDIDAGTDAGYFVDQPGETIWLRYRSTGMRTIEIMMDGVVFD